MTLQRRFVRTVAGFGALMVVTLLLTPLVGPTSIDLRRVFDFSIPFAENVDAQIFFVARLPRTLAGAFVGALFASAGVVFQGLLRNPLATPFTLGVSTGAALGAILAITFNLSLAFMGVSAVPLAAFAGSLMAVAIVYALAQARHRGLSTTVLLLAGVTMNAFFSAMILFVQYFASFADTYRTLRWLMGDLDVASYQPILAALPTTAVAFAVFAWLARPLNLLSLGPTAPSRAGWTWPGRSVPHSSAPRSPPGPPSRSADRSASSASSSRTWCGCWSVRITVWCCRRPPFSAPRFSSPAISWRAPSSRPWNCLLASSPL